MSYMDLDPAEAPEVTEAERAAFGLQVQKMAELMEAIVRERIALGPIPVDAQEARWPSGAVHPVDRGNLINNLGIFSPDPDRESRWFRLVRFQKDDDGCHFWAVIEVWDQLPSWAVVAS